MHLFLECLLLEVQLGRVTVLFLCYSRIETLLYITKFRNTKILFVMHLQKTKAGSDEGDYMLTVQLAGALWQLLLAPSAAWLVAS